MGLTGMFQVAHFGMLKRSSFSSHLSLRVTGVIIEMFEIILGYDCSLIGTSPESLGSELAS